MNEMLNQIVKIYTKQCNMCHYLCMWLLFGLSVAMCVVFGGDLNLHLKNLPFNELPECSASLNNQSQYFCSYIDSCVCIRANEGVIAGCDGVSDNITCMYDNGGCSYKTSSQSFETQRIYGGGGSHSHTHDHPATCIQHVGYFCNQYEVEFQTDTSIFLQTIQCGLSECVNDARLTAVKHCGFIGSVFYFEDPNSKYPEWSKQTDTIMVGIFAPFGLICITCACCIVYWCGGYNPIIKLPQSSAA